MDERCNHLYLIVILQYLQKKTLSWKNWNPQKLQTQISTSLRTSVNKRKSAASVDHSASTSSQNKRSKNDFVPSALKGTAKKTSNQLKQKVITIAVTNL